MGLFDTIGKVLSPISMLPNLSGGRQRRDINEGAAASRRILGESKTAAHQNYDQGLSQSIGYLQPYMQGGSDANALVRAALGLDGVDAQRDYYQSFQADPGYQSLLDATLKASQRQANYGGRNYSGAAIAGQGQVAGTMTNQLYNQRLDRLTELGKMGLGAAGGAATSTLGTYGSKADLESGYGQLNSNVEQARSNAIAGTRNTLTNNLFKVAELGTKFMGA